MGKIEFDMPEIENVPERWRQFAEEAGVEALMCLARIFKGDKVYIPTEHYLLSESEKIKSGKDRVNDTRKKEIDSP
tara:strand:+ start:670 stop:897 length:228 start_codon:yes stop_codon:yes gene_type:complete